MSYTPSVPDDAPICTLNLQGFVDAGGCQLAQSGSVDVGSIFIGALLLVVAGFVCWIVYKAKAER